MQCEVSLRHKISLYKLYFWQLQLALPENLLKPLVVWKTLVKVFSQFGEEIKFLIRTWVHTYGSLTNLNVQQID